MKKKWLRQTCPPGGVRTNLDNPYDAQAERGHPLDERKLGQNQHQRQEGTRHDQQRSLRQQNDDKTTKRQQGVSSERDILVDMSRKKCESVVIQQ